MNIRLLTCAVIVALVAAACGSDDATTISEPTATDAVDAAVPDPSQPEPPDTASTSVSEDGTVSDNAVGDGAADGSTAAAPVDPGDVPDFEMIDVQTDTRVNLQSVVDGSTPLLFWFWAPH